MHTIGTAGHVDHGKSTLVLALTGLNPDRLREEQERGMTIELGFAWLTLPSGRSVSIVDVPGHEDFIRNMLAGVGGIDAALLVVAADDGVMPQTREHLAILDLLGVSQGIVALTKVDRVEDPEWLELVEADLAEVLQGTSLEGAEIVRVAAPRGQGIAEMKQRIDAMLDQMPARADRGRARLPIDRAFTVAGFGTIVTGTLGDGRLREGDEVVVYPQRLAARIRGLQIHKRKVQEAEPGARVAVNLTGVGPEQLSRGNVLGPPGAFEPTRLVDARVRLLDGLARGVRHNEPVEMFWGSARTLGRLRLLATEELEPGETGWAQIRLSAPAVLMRGDRFVLRQPALGLTIGGGLVVDPHPRYHRHSEKGTGRKLEALMSGDPAEVLLEVLRQRSPCLLEDAARAADLPAEVAGQAVVRLRDSGQVLLLGRGGNEAGSSPVPPEGRAAGVVVEAERWAKVREQVLGLLRDYHRQYPLRAAMRREELRNRLRMDPRVFNEVLGALAGDNVLVSTATTVRDAQHEVRFTAEQQQAVRALREAFRKAPYSPPSPAEVGVSPELVEALIEQGELVKIAGDLYYQRQVYQEMMDRIVSFIRTHGSISVQQVRELFGCSRKYSLPFLEHLDSLRVTRRVGDNRVLREELEPSPGQAARDGAGAGVAGRAAPALERGGMRRGYLCRGDRSS